MSWLTTPSDPILSSVFPCIFLFRARLDLFPTIRPIGQSLARTRSATFGMSPLAARNGEVGHQAARRRGAALGGEVSGTTVSPGLPGLARFLDRQLGLMGAQVVPTHGGPNFFVTRFAFLQGGPHSLGVPHNF